MSELTEVCLAKCRLENGNCDIEGDEIIWDWCGDCQCWHIGCFREAIINRYGIWSVSGLEKNNDGVWFFRHIKDVDWKLIGEDMGVVKSSPSISSNSNEK